MVYLAGTGAQLRELQLFLLLLFQSLSLPATQRGAGTRRGVLLHASAMPGPPAARPAPRLLGTQIPGPGGRGASASTPTLAASPKPI